ncbi:MAG TPA: PHP domain-containing protein [Elusimicrobiales bacterium]|nr:PHP domain-containing protein [Elusimicrobiales bacterium]
MPGLINLHNHSKYSDGTLAPAELAREARRAGIKYFSLTDHDIVNGWVEMEPALKEAGITYCYGVELTTDFHDSLHILGYGVDVRDARFLASLAGYREKRLERLKKIIALLAGQGIDIKFEELPLEVKTLGRPHIADLLKKKGVVSSRKQGFQRYVAYGMPAYVPPCGPDVEAAIRAIKDAGGLAVLAHPGVVKNVLDLPRWKAAGLDGIEAFYPAHTQTATREFIALAGRYDLFVTAGNDFHGPGSDRDKMDGFEYSPEQFAGIGKVFL